MRNHYVLFKKLTGHIFHFIRTKNFLDALRVSLVIILPPLFFFAEGMTFEAISTCTGSLLISLIDYPGALYERRKAYQALIAGFAVLSFFTAVILNHPWVLGLFICSACFIYAMFTVYSSRSSVIGSACLILIIFVIGLHPANPYLFCLWVTLGAVWAYFVSEVIEWLFPFSAVSLALGDAIVEMATFFSLREAYYEPYTDLNQVYQTVITQHDRVSEKQERLRAFVLKEKRIIDQTHPRGKYFLKVSILIIDLYEQMRVMPLDYDRMRQTIPAETQALIRTYIRLTAKELTALGKSLQTGQTYLPDHQNILRLARVQQDLGQAQTKNAGFERQVMTAVLHNMSLIDQQLNLIKSLMLSAGVNDPIVLEKLVYNEYIDAPPDLVTYLNLHTKFNSPIFRYALRTAVVMAFAYLLTFLLPLGRYSYWLLLTIVIVSRPSFSTTRKRNKSRIVGTFYGLLAALIIMAGISSTAIQVMIVCYGLLVFFILLQLNYTWCVAHITLAVIIGLKLLHGDHYDMLLERIMDTLLGCSLAYFAVYLFPNWESTGFKGLLVRLLAANIRYLEHLQAMAGHETLNAHAYRLTRKAVYVGSTDLSQALQRMAKEPRKWVSNEVLIKDYLLLNNLLYTSISALMIPSRLSAADWLEPADHAVLVQATDCLKYALYQLSAKSEGAYQKPTLYVVDDDREGVLNEPIKKKQIRYLLYVSNKISYQINKINVDRSLVPDQ